MRGELAVGVLVVALLFSGLWVAPNAHGTPSAPNSSPAGATFHESNGPAPDGPTWTTAAHPLPMNSTLAPWLVPPRSAAAPPTSARQVTPVPQPPPTTPTVMQFLNASPICCVIADFSAPSGSWAMIVLNYTGQAVGGVYDSSFRAYVDQVQVLFGTTPEYGQWYVSKDITRYASLFQGTFNFTFLLSAATVGGYFLTTVSIAFYPAPPGGEVPAGPDVIVPLFHRVFVSPSTLTVSTVATVPSNVVNATLEFWTYAFDADEFWYTTQPGFRGAFVDVDGAPIAATFPFPFINTGGSDPFAWRPITAAFTLDNPAYEFDVTAALGLLEGTHNFTANISGAGPGSNWLIGGALLLYTNASARAASLLSYSASTPRATLSTDHVTYYDQSDSVSYSYSSSVPVGSDLTNVSLSTNATYASAMDLSPTWTNLTLHSATSTHVVWSNASERRDVVRSLDFPFRLDLGGSFVLTSTTGGGYPKFGNFTQSMLNAFQGWDESTLTTTSSGGGPPTTAFHSVDQRLIGGNNLYAGTEELTGPNSALITGIDFIESQTTDRYAESEFAGALPFAYDHILIGSAYQPPGPNEEETVVIDQVDSPVHARLTVAPGTTEVGVATELGAAADGGNGSFSFRYEGLPSGCVSVNATVLSCVPTEPGVYTIVLYVADRDGLAAVPEYATLVVNAPPSVSISVAPAAAEVGRTTNFSARVVSGTGPFDCVWSVDGNASSAQSCDLTFSLTPAAAGRATVNVSTTDALGTRASATLSVDVAPVTSVVIQTASGTNLTVGDWLILVANATGADPILSATWYSSGAEPVPIASPPLTLIFRVTAVGTFQEVVTVVDGAGGTATSSPFTYNVSAAGAGPVNAAPAETPLLSTGLYVGLLAGAVIGTVLGLLIGRRGRPPSARGPRASPPVPQN